MASSECSHPVGRQEHNQNARKWTDRLHTGNSAIVVRVRVYDRHSFTGLKTHRSVHNVIYEFMNFLFALMRRKKTIPLCGLWPSSSSLAAGQWVNGIISRLVSRYFIASSLGWMGWLGVRGQSSYQSIYSSSSLLSASSTTTTTGTTNQM